MRRFLYFLLLVFCFSVVCFSQSGRKVEPKDKQASEEKPLFSETSIYKRRRLYKPVDEGKLKKRKKKRDKANKKAKVKPALLNEEEADDIITVDSTLVTIPVSVYSRGGLYVPNLKQADFKIFEDNVEHDIAYFGTTDKPFTVVLLIDTSPSTAYSINQIRDAAMVFVDELKPQDRVMVISFDSGIRTLTKATNDRKKIKKAIGAACPPEDGDGETIEVKGRDLSTGIPKEMILTEKQISESLTEPVDQIIEAIKVALECTPPELSSDIVEKGIVLSGGGSMLKNLDYIVRQATGLPVFVAQDPLLCVVNGCGKVLENMKLFRAVLFRQD